MIPKQKRSEGLNIGSQPQLKALIVSLCERLNMRCPEKLTYSGDNYHQLCYQYGGWKFWAGKRQLQLSMPMMACLPQRQQAAELTLQLALYRSGLLAIAQGVSAAIEQRLTDVLEGRAEGGATQNQAGFKPIAFVKSRYVDLSAVIFVRVAALLAMPLNRIRKALILKADHYAISIVGSRDHIDTIKARYVYQHALQRCNEQLYEQVDHPQLVDNIPSLVRYHLERIPKPELKQLIEDVDCGLTRAGIAYPSDRDRIVFAEELNLIGLQWSEGEQLLGDETALYQQATIDFYHQRGIYPDHQVLLNVRSLAKQALKNQLREDFVTQYFNHWFSEDVFWRIPGVDVIEGQNSEERKEQLNLCNDRVRHHTADFLKHREHCGSIFTNLAKLSFASELRKAGYKGEASELNLSDEQFRHLPEFLTEAKKQWDADQIVANKLGGLMGRRLLFAVMLNNDAARRKRGMLLLQILSGLANQTVRLLHMRMRVEFLPSLEQRITEKLEKNHQKRIVQICKDIDSLAGKSLQSLIKFPCLFDEEFETLADYIHHHVGTKPSLDKLDANQWYNYYQRFSHAVGSANRLINAQLVIICQQSEEQNEIRPVRVDARSKVLKNDD